MTCHSFHGAAIFEVECGGARNEAPLVNRNKHITVSGYSVTQSRNKHRKCSRHVNTHGNYACHESLWSKPACFVIVTPEPTAVFESTFIATPN